jgi:hypothetical protein
MMRGLFEGKPQTATSYATSSSETPKWMQDAIYNQIQVAQNIANTPYQPYNKTTVAGLSPLQQQAYANVVANQGSWAPAMQRAQLGMAGFGSADTADELRADQSGYLRQDLVNRGLDAGQRMFGQAGETTAQAVSERALQAANPYLQAAGQTSASQVGQYMSPYQTGVMDVIAKQGARNLTENILPGVSDAFIKAGQFGSSRMGEMGSRALRDTQEAILSQQAQAAQQGYTQALDAAQADLARQGQLAGTVGSISGADLSRILQGGSQYGQLGQLQTQAGQGQQQFGLSAAQAAQAAQADDYRRQMSALSQTAAMGQQEQGMRAADVAALETAGAAQQGQLQRQLDDERARYLEAQLYPKQQMDWLSTQIRGMAPITPQIQNQSSTTTGATYGASPLSQLATGLYTYKGLQEMAKERPWDTNSIS